MPTVTPIIPPEARLSFQCLDIASMLTGGVTSSGVVVLESRVIVDSRYKPETFLLDMTTGAVTQVARQGESQGSFTVSLDRKFMAYESVIFNAEGKIVNDELVIATADGQRQKAIPWEEGWFSLIGWLDNQRLIISLDELDGQKVNLNKKPAPSLVLNPITGERQVLRPDFPRFLDTPSTILPYWDGWFGVIYDPTLTRAIYPRFVGDDDEMYTYAIWNVSKRQLVASLESIFAAFSVFNDTYPMPLWSLDGSQFIFRGVVETSDPVEFELFRVSRDGQVEQLTHLTPTVYVQDSNLSWSPDHRYIAMFLNELIGSSLEQEVSVAVLDIKTLGVTDYCIPINYSGERYGGGQPPWPIWSPDSKQFLVVDWYQKDHKSVILVDIAQGFAAQIAEDMEPVGWMVSP